MSCIVGYEQGNDLTTSDVSEFDWVWDANSRSTATLLSCDTHKVNFHSDDTDALSRILWASPLTAFAPCSES